MARKRQSETMSIEDIAGNLGFTSIKDSDYAHVDDYLPTFLPQIDVLMNGGFPFGRMIEVYSPEQTGKSTFMMEINRMMNALGGQAFWLDAEGSADRDRMMELGVNTEQSWAFAPQSADLTVEQIGNKAEEIIKGFSQDNLKNVPFLIIWDSVGATPAQEELDGEEGDTMRLGRKAAAVTKLVTRVGPLLKEANVAFIAINQVRANVNPKGKYDVSLNRPGGSAFDHWASLRLELRAGTKLRDADKNYYGHVLRVVTDKSKISRPKQKDETWLISRYALDKVNPDDPSTWVYADGVDYEWNVYNQAKILGFITSSNKYRKYTPEKGQEISIETANGVSSDDQWITYLKSEAGAEVRRELFQKILYHYFPFDFPPLHNKNLDVTIWPDMKGVKQHYAKLDKTKK